MALSVTTATGPSAVGALTQTSASFTPTANAVLVVSFGGGFGGGAAASPTILDTAGLSWTAFTNAPQGGGFSNLALWYAQVGASPSSMTVTTTYGAGSGPQLVQTVTQIAGNAVSSPVLQNTSNTTFSSSSTSSFGFTPTATSAVVGVICNPSAGAADPTVPSGFTELTHLVDNGNTSLTQVAYIIGSGPQNVTWTGAGGTNYQGIIEIAVGVIVFIPPPPLVIDRQSVRSMY